MRVATADPVAALSAPAYAVTYADLQFDDGHVERWLGSGWLHEREPDDDEPLEPLESLVQWGREAFEDQQDSLLAELGREFTGDPHDHLASVPIEIVIEWNGEVPAPD